VLTVVGSLKASAGATTVAAVLGYCRRATVVEADPAGGDVAGWMGWPDVGLSDLAAAAVRHGRLRVEDLRGCARITPAGVPVVAAPLGPEGAAGSTARVVEALPKLATETDLVVDAGRLDPAAPAARLLARADAVVLLVVPVAGELARLRARLPGLVRLCGRRLAVVLVDAACSGQLRYPAGEVSRVLGCPVAAWLPYDPRTAAMVATGPGRLPPWERLGWWGRWRWPLLAAVSRL
jgi:hypothetical protein